MRSRDPPLSYWKTDCLSKGIKPSVGGWGRIIGHNTIFVDDRDPLAHGFQIR